MKRANPTDVIILEFFMKHLAFNPIKPKRELEILWVKYMREENLSSELKSFDHLFDSIDDYYSRTQTRRKYGIQKES